MQSLPSPNTYSSFLGWIVPHNIPAPGPVTVPTLAQVLAAGNTTGTTDVVVQAKLIMPSEAVGTTNLLSVTRVPGVPTSAGVTTGSLAVDTVGGDLYFFDGAAWVALGAAGGTPTWSAVLATGNTSGANDAVMSASRSLTFEGSVRIGGNNSSTVLGDALSVNIGQNTGTLATESVIIGNVNTSTQEQTVCIGYSNSTTAAASIAIGQSSSVSAAESVALGASNSVISANGTALGSYCSVEAIQSCAVGYTCEATGIRSTCIGNTGTASGADGICIGSSCSTSTGLFNTSIGSTAVVSALGDQNIAFGSTVSIAGDATADNNVAIGSNIALTGNFANRVCIGQASNAAGTGSTSIGYQCTAPTNATVLGFQSNAGDFGFSAGYQATGTGANGVSLGVITVCNGQNGVAIGNTASATALRSIAIGSIVTAAGDGSIAIGRQTNTSTGAYNTAIGFSTAVTALGDQNLAFGAGVSIAGDATSDNNVAIGSNITMTGNFGNRIAIGQASICNAADGIAIGRSANASSTDAIAIGRGAASNVANSVAVGGGVTVGITGGTAIGNGAIVNTNSNGSAFGRLAVCYSNEGVALGYNAQTGTGSQNTVIGSSSSLPNTCSSSIILGRGSTTAASLTNVICLGNGLTAANVTTGSSIYTITGLTTVAASVALNYNTATGRIFPVTSSIRYKRDVQDFRDTSDILTITPKDYAFKEGHCGCACDVDEDGTPLGCSEKTCCRREVGYIAEDMEKIFPELCSYGIDAEGKPRVESIQYDRLVLLLIPEVRKLRDRVAELEQKFIS